MTVQFTGKKLPRVLRNVNFFLSRSCTFETNAYAIQFYKVMKEGNSPSGARFFVPHGFSPISTLSSRTMVSSAADCCLLSSSS